MFTPVPFLLHYFNCPVFIPDDYKSNISERDWSRFDQENFMLDYFPIDWEDLLKIDELNVDNSIFRKD